MVRIAPRYDFRIVELVHELDDRSVSIAEVCRRIARAAEDEGLTRPSYVHLRRIVWNVRHRREAVRSLAAAFAADALSGRVPNALYYADRVRDLPPGR